jgi:cell wall assembly regulator SMI1
MDQPLLNYISDAIDEHPDLADFIGEVTEDKVEEAELRLGVKFPEDYRWFCKKLGCGAFGSEEIYGIVQGEPSSIPSVVFANEKADEYGVPKDILLIKNEDEWHCAIDLSRTDGTYPVITWVVGLPKDEQVRTVIAASFLEFLVECIDTVLSWEVEEKEED